MPNPASECDYFCQLTDRLGRLLPPPDANCHVPASSPDGGKWRMGKELTQLQLHLRTRQINDIAVGELARAVANNLSIQQGMIPLNWG